MSTKSLRSALFVTLALTMACSSEPPEVSGQQARPQATSNRDMPAFAGSEPWTTDFSKMTVPAAEIASGGPPRDGIPAIDNPKFVSIRRAERDLDDRDPLAVVRIGDEVRAYPLNILIWHEIVNDEFGGVPVSVTFCPLCNTTLAFDRRFDGKVLDFGTTGRLRHSDLVMYDRQTETWWQQATGEGIIGEYAGERLTFISAPVMSWKDVKDLEPNAQVLSRDTGHSRNYGRNPYAGYDTGAGPIGSFFQFGRNDDRLQAMERVVALEGGDEFLAVSFDQLADKKLADVEVGGVEMVVFWAPGTASALDQAQISDGRDVGSSSVFDPTLNGRRLTFENAGEGIFRDDQTGSTWNMSGVAVEGELAGERLSAVPHGNHFWFAWGTFRPETEIWNGR